MKRNCLDTNKLEGKEVGSVDLGQDPEQILDEQALKEWIQELFPPDIKGLIIMDTCHSGAWTG